MPARKKRNDKPKSYSKRNKNHKTLITIYQSSLPNFQHQAEEKSLKASSMEDSSNAKVDEAKEVVVEDIGVTKIDVESVKTLDIVDDGNTNSSNHDDETKRDISIVEEIAGKDEKARDGDESSSSSSSSSDDDDDDDDGNREKEEKAETEEKVESTNIMCVDAIPSIVEDLVLSVESKLESSSSFKDKDDGGEDSKEAEEKEDEDQGSNTVEPPKGVHEAPTENVDDHQITPNVPIVMPAVTGGLLQSSSWKSCCGLFEFLHRSET